MHKTPNLAQLSTPRRAQARPVAVSWPLAWPFRGQGRPCCRPQAAVSQPPLERPCAVLRTMLCRAPTQRPACRTVALAAMSWALAARQPGRIVAWAVRYAARLAAVSWACCALYRNTMPSSLMPPGHNTLNCIAIQSSILLAISVTIQYLVLQYNFLPNQLHTLAIKFAVLQYNS